MNSITSLLENLKENQVSITAVVGAGISKASGMPTFRGEDGLWNQYRAQDLATPSAFANNPELVWQWYRARMRILLEAKPNPAHYSLTQLEKEGLLIGVITQNVDGLHEIADTKNIIEIHGNIRYARCENCNYKKRWDQKELTKKELPIPICPKCKKNLLRPDVVWFGEPLDQEKWQKAMNMVLDSSILLVIGTSGVVQPVASLPQYAKMNKAKVIEFNIEKTPLSFISDYSFFGPCEETLPEFSKKLINFLKE